MASDKKPHIHLTDLPDIVIIHAFTFLPINSLLSICAVSKQFKHFAETDIIWKQKCNRISNKAKLKYKSIYHTHCTKEWIHTFSSPSYAHLFSITEGMPQTQCVSVINNKKNNQPIIYFGASKPVYGYTQPPISGLFYHNKYDSKNAPKPILFNNEWKYDMVTHMDAYNDKLLCCATTSENTDNILILDAQNIELLFTLKHNCNQKTTCNYRWHQPISQVKFSDNGNLLFSASPRACDVILWDINKQKQLRIFDHFNITDDSERESEIYSVCPTQSGTYFVSGSYNFLYVWDRRVHKYNGLINSVEFYSKQESGFYPMSLTGFIENETRFLCIGKRPAKIQTFEFPSFEYELKENDFCCPAELNGLCITAFDTVACDVYGNVFLWNNYIKGKAIRLKPKGHWYSGSGYNDCSVNSSLDTIALSMYNIGSGWNFGGGVVFSGSGDKIQLSKEENKQKQRDCHIL
eukprot:172598_1